MAELRAMQRSDITYRVFLPSNPEVAPEKAVHLALVDATSGQL